MHNSRGWAGAATVATRTNRLIVWGEMPKRGSGLYGVGTRDAIHRGHSRSCPVTPVRGGRANGARPCQGQADEGRSRAQVQLPEHRPRRTAARTHRRVFGPAAFVELG